MLSASHKSMYSMSCEPTVRRTVRKGIQHAIRVYVHMRTHVESCMQHETYALPCTAAWHCTVSMGASSTAPHEKRTHAHPRHGLRLQMRPYRAASTRRAGLRQCCSSCCWKRILVNKGVERRRTGVSQHHPSHEKAAVAPLRLPSAAQTAAFHSKYRLEAAPHPFWTSRFYNFQILFSGSALLAARS
jgi:hypothetical protein